SLRFEGTEMLLPRLPLRYDDWGIRESWKSPVLVRMAADAQIPAGKQTFLLRARGLSRLWVNGELVAQTKPLEGSPSGEEPITPVAAPPLPGLRPANHRLQEVLGEVEIADQETVRIVVEAMAGGKRFRPEPGELTVALRSPDGTSYYVLQPSQSSDAPLPLTNDAIEQALERIESLLGRYDDRNRREAARSQDQFWKHRHELARQWVKDNPPPQTPSVGSITNPIDAFLAKRIQDAKEADQANPLEEAHK